MIIVVDTGGTKTLIAGFINGDKISRSIKIPTPSDQDEYINQVRKIIDEKFSDQPIDALVVAMPGIVHEGVAIWCNNLKWQNFNIGQALRTIYPEIPVLIENDANLAGLSEARNLQPIPPQVLYVTISTGIGTGIITYGEIDTSLASSEGGHILVEYDDKVREWESFASGKAIYEHFKQYARDIEDPKKWEEIADRISRGFLAVIPLLQPQTIVIGGSIGTYFDKYSSKLTELLQHNLPDHILVPEFRQAAHAEEAVVYGGYLYGFDHLDIKAHPA